MIDNFFFFKIDIFSRKMNESLQLLTVPSALRETQTSKTRRFFLAPCFDKGMSGNLKYVGQKLKMKMVKVMHNPKKTAGPFLVCKLRKTEESDIFIMFIFNFFMFSSALFQVLGALPYNRCRCKAQIQSRGLQWGKKYKKNRGLFKKKNPRSGIFFS